MRINKRLLAISNYVLDNSKIIDVGCDHALLDIYLALNKDNVTCIASDINERPLKQAEDNINKYDVSDKVKIKLGDGIETIEEDVDTIVISGMGASNIIEILKNKEKLQNVRRLILSPNNDFYELRKALFDLDLRIVEESVVCDRGKFYPILIVEKGSKIISKVELLYGYNVNYNDDYKKYLNYENETLTNNLKEIPKKYILKRIDLKRKIDYINEILI